MMKITFDLQDSHLALKQGHLRMGQQNRYGDSIEATNRYLLKNGRPWIPVMGEFHYSRYDRSEWETELLKMKAGGILVVSSYLIWLHHEEEKGTFLFEGDRDVKEFVTLCKKHDLYFFARLGPWVHAEVRNGGFPDWILPMQVRTNDPDYLFYVKRLYEAYYEQLKDLLFEQGGPVIGVQLENELTDRPEHLLKLKETAVAAGFTVPLYTVTAWGVSGIGQFPEYEVLPVFGSYPEAPWRQNTDPFERKPHYLFAPGRNDITIGSDLIKGFTASPSEEILDDYPYAYCEIGPGVQVTYHRRPVIRPYDLYSIMMITLAKGNNLPGYYVYHGGRNPKGPLKLYQESRLTGYPNDLPVISYDFQAPLGEYGFVKSSYDYYRLLHLFLAQYGEELAVCVTHYPDIGPKDRKDPVTPRCAVRVNEQGSGYVFFNTNQRNEQLEAVRRIQIRLMHQGEEQTMPVYPVDIPEGTSCFFPVNRPVGAGMISYALAQPVTELTYEGEQYMFLAAVDGIAPEILLHGDVELLKVKGSVEYLKEGILLTELPTGRSPAVSLISDGTVKHMIFLTWMDALRLYRTRQNGQDYVFLSDAHMYFEESHMVLYGEADEGAFELGVFPPVSFSGWAEGCRRGSFTYYRIPVKKCRAKISLEEAETEILKQNPYTPYLFTDEMEETKEYLLYVSIADEGDMDDIRVLLSGEFDVMQVYEGQELTGDCFHRGGLEEIGVGRHRECLFCGRPLRLKLSPYKTGKQVFLEQKIERDVMALTLYQWKIQYKKRLEFAQKNGTIQQ